MDSEQLVMSITPPRRPGAVSLHIRLNATETATAKGDTALKTTTEPTNGRSRQPRKGMRVSRRVRVAIPLATAAAALSVASTAWACTYFSGQTYFDNPATTGTLEQTDELPSTWKPKVLTNSTLVVWGKGVPAGENYPSSPWKVVASAFGQCCGSGTGAITPVGSTYTFTQSPTGTVAQLGPTPSSGTNAAKAPGISGTYSVCWLYGDRSGKALNPATLTTVNR